MKRMIMFLMFLPFTIWAQHTIEGAFSPAGDFTYAFLYKSDASGSVYLDRAKVDDSGHFKIDLDDTNTPGIYKIVYGLPQEEHNFDLIYNGKENVVFSFSFNEGLEFKESSENKLWASYTHSFEMINQAISNFYKKESKDEVAFKDIFKTLKETQDAFEQASKGTMVSAFVKANKPYIPEAYEDISTYSKNIKDTYLKNVDFSDSLLQSSEFLTDRVMAYVFGMSPHPTVEFYKGQIDNLVGYIGAGNQEVKLALLRSIWLRMVDIEEEEVAVYIGNTYLFELAENAEDDLLLSVLTIQKNTTIGATAIDFPIVLDKKGKKTPSSLHQLKGSDNYLLIFWNSGCSHCLQQLPEVRKTADGINSKTLSVIAFGTQGDTEEWRNEITKYPAFIHVIGTESPARHVNAEYGIEATPTYFILDKDKKITAKPDTLSELLTILNNM